MKITVLSFTGLEPATQGFVRLKTMCDLNHAFNAKDPIGHYHSKHRVETVL
jgi:hypothetical protein